MNNIKQKILMLHSILLSISTNYITKITNPKHVKSHFRLPFCTFFFCFHLFSLFWRLLISTVILNCHYTDLSNSFFNYDLMTGFFVRMNLLDGNLCLVLCPATIFLIFLHCSVHFSHGLTFFAYAHDLIVINREHFFALNPHLSFAILKNDLFKSNQKKLSMIKFSSEQLAYFPNLPHCIRCQAVFISLTFDVLIAVFVLLLALFSLFGLFYYYVYIFWPMYTYFQSSVIAIEISIVFYSVWQSTKILLFYVHVINLTIFALVSQQKIQNIALQSVINSQSKIKNVHQLAFYLKSYFDLHVQFIRFLFFF